MNVAASGPLAGLLGGDAGPRGAEAPGTAPEASEGETLHTFAGVLLGALRSEAGETPETRGLNGLLQGLLEGLAAEGADPTSDPGAADGNESAPGGDESGGEPDPNAGDPAGGPDETGGPHSAEAGEGSLEGREPRLAGAAARKGDPGILLVPEPGSATGAADGPRWPRATQVDVPSGSESPGQAGAGRTTATFLADATGRSPGAGAATAAADASLTRVDAAAASSRPDGPLAVGRIEEDGAPMASDEVSPARAEAARPTAAASANRDPSVLDPELVDRIDRVTRRMAREFGHRVEVIEGYRSPERQARLFAQGRSEPGPVVTWTRSSRHSQGRAADLRVDGTWNSPEGYARLQKVAREEGLVTLGPRDPGHVELPAEGGGRATGSRSGTPGVPGAATAETWGATSSLAGAARVAAVARPANVAGPARVAVPGRRSPGAAQAHTGAPVTPDDPGTPFPRGNQGQVATGSTDAPLPPRGGDGSDGSRAGHPGDGVHRMRVDGDATLTPAEGLRTATRPDPGPASGAGDTIPRASARDLAALANELMGDPSAWRPAAELGMGAREVAAASATGATTLERIEQIQQLREAAGLAGPGEIRLDLDEREGLGARIRMALRGSSLSTTIDMDDPAAARRMQARISDLHRALENRGLDPVALGVRGVRGAADAAEAGGLSASGPSDPLKVAAGGGAQGGDGTSREREQGNPDQGRREWREFLDGSRRDHRRERDRD